MRERVIVTGITGFVGKNLTKYLKDKCVIQGVSRTKSNNYVSYEELNVNLLNESDVFVHLAGKAHDLKNVSKPEEYFDVNTNLTKRIFDVFLKSECKTFIYMSSVKAVADTVQGILTEKWEPSPLTPYGQSKLAAEEYLLSQEIGKDKRVYILRPCMIHGPGNKGNLNSLYSFVNKGIPYPLGRFKNKRSFVSIENLCFIIKHLVKGNINSGVFNVADDEALSTFELVSLISNVIDRPLRKIDLPKKIVKIIAKVGDIISLPINSHRLDKLTENYVVDNQKIKKELNVNLPISTREGLQKTIKAFK